MIYYHYFFFVAINLFFLSNYSIPIGYLFIFVIVLFTFVNVHSVNITSIVLVQPPMMITYFFKNQTSSFSHALEIHCLGLLGQNPILF